MLIRKMRPTDAEAVATVHTLSWQAAYRGIVDQTFLDSIDLKQRATSWRRGLETNDPPLIRIVAEVDNRVVGFASGLENRKKSESLSCDSELWALYVLPEQTGRGIGKALLTEFKSELRAAGRTRLCIWALEANHPARLFYQAQGGVESGFRLCEIGSQRLPELGYEFSL